MHSLLNDFTGFRPDQMAHHLRAVHGQPVDKHDQTDLIVMLGAHLLARDDQLPDPEDEDTEDDTGWMPVEEPEPAECSQHGLTRVLSEPVRGRHSWPGSRWGGWQAPPR